MKPLVVDDDVLDLRPTSVGWKFIDVAFFSGELACEKMPRLPPSPVLVVVVVVLGPLV